MRLFTIQINRFLSILCIYLSLISNTSGDNMTLVGSGRAQDKNWYSPTSKKACLDPTKKQLLYMRADTGEPKSYFASFTVAVDAYAELQVPNSYGLYEAGGGLKITMLYYDNTEAGQIYPWSSTAVNFTGYSKGGGQTSAVIVLNRTLLIQTYKGYIQSFEWAPTSCRLDPSGSPVGEGDFQICGYNSKNYANHNITVRVAWSGTDCNGNALKSYTTDIWRLQHAL